MITRIYHHSSRKRVSHSAHTVPAVRQALQLAPSLAPSCLPYSLLIPGHKPEPYEVMQHRYRYIPPLGPARSCSLPKTLYARSGPPGPSCHPY